MKTSDLNIVILEPSNPKNWLTNGDIFSKKVYLGRNDSESNWREITNAEKLELVGEGLCALPEDEQQGGDDI